jgi:Protein of unknown function (DUF2563)
MADGKIEISTAHLSAAGESCGDAADSVRRAGDELAGATAGAGIFGDFAEAESFHGKFSTAHHSHQERLQVHHSTLRGLSGRAALAAQAFSKADESAADDLGAAGSQFG